MRKHIAFIVESAHGHVNPTLGIASELVKRGYRVSHAVKDSFAARVTASGAEAKIYRPLETKLDLFREMAKDRSGEFLFDFSRVDLNQFSKESFQKESDNTLSQLEDIYENDRPDLVIFDVMNPAGMALASAWGISSIEHCPMMIEAGGAEHTAGMVIVSLPEFLQESRETLDERFHFIGPVFNEGAFFKPLSLAPYPGPTVLVSATTGLLPQVDFFLTAIHAFETLPWRIILSVGEELDPAMLDPLPENFQINQFSSQPKILEQSSLFIGQGGPASILEALRCGVPPLLIPPSQVHDLYARRVEKLKLGARLPHKDFSADTLRTAATSLMRNQLILDRVAATQRQLQENLGAIHAADLVEQYMSREMCGHVSKHGKNVS